MDRDALHFLLDHPVQAGKWCGFTKLQEQLHGPWIQNMVCGQGDATLLAHRNSYKTTCLTLAIALRMILYPRQNILFFRKTDDDVLEVIRQVRTLMTSAPMRILSARIWGEAVLPLRGDMHQITTTAYQAPRGAPQLLGMGIGSSLTGKHADILFTDDIVNLQDRISPAERQRTKEVYMELQNIRIPGGRLLNTGTPWHPEDAISLMPAPQRFNVYETGLFTPDQISGLKAAMSPSLFAANYELRHTPAEDALFSSLPPQGEEDALVLDGIAHVDAAYGGEDQCALTLGQLRGDTLYLMGQLRPGHVDQHLNRWLDLCREMRCAPIHVETNGDKGYLAREIRRRGMAVRLYAERMNKGVKIATYLRGWWPKIRFTKSTDEGYIRQILDYTEHAVHDDAPDSAACICRIMEGRLRRSI